MPTVVPVAVRNAPVCIWFVALAMPKSAILTRPSAVTIRFSGLRSRWTIPCCLGVGEPGEQALEHAADLRERQLPHVRAQRAALDVLHRDVRRAVVLEVVVHGDDVRVAQRAGHARLAQEALRERRVRGVERAQLLERDEAVEVGLAREVDDRHAAAADLPQDLVAADGLHDVRHSVSPSAVPAGRQLAVVTVVESGMRAGAP